MRQLKIVGSALVGIAAVALGSALAATTATAALGEPEIEVKPRVERVLLDRGKGRDRAIVLARVDNPLHTRGVGQTVLDAGATSHRARAHLVLRSGGTRIASVRSGNQDLSLHGVRRDQRATFTVPLPRGFDPSGRGATSIDYSATVAHVLSPAEEAEANDRAKSSVSGNVGSSSFPGSPISHYYDNSNDNRVSPTMSLEVDKAGKRLFVSDINLVGECGQGESKGSSDAWLLTNGGLEHPSSGFIDSIATSGPPGGYDATAAGVLNWDKTSYTSSTEDREFYPSIGATATVQFSLDGKRATVRIPAERWQYPTDPDGWPPPALCTLPATTVTLTAPPQ